MGKKHITYYKFWEADTPEEFDLSFTFKGLTESIEGLIRLAEIRGKKTTLTIETLSEKEYKDELKKKR